MKQISKKKGVIALALVALLAGMAAAWALTRPAISREIQKKADFTIFYPESGADWHADRKSIAYNDETKVLSIKLTNGTRSIGLNQQASPAAFTDIPQQFPRMLDKLHQYTEVDTGIGRVTLTRPEELKGGQSAVANLRGTLMFANPDKDMSEPEWRELFDSLVVYK